MSTKKIGEFLKRARKMKSMSLQDLSNKTEISFSYIALLERGKVAPPQRKHLSRLAEVLGIDELKFHLLVDRLPIFWEDQIVMLLKGNEKITLLDFWKLLEKK